MDGICQRSTKGVINLSSSPDRLCWSYDTISRVISAKKVYQQLMQNSSSTCEWWYSLWYWKAPPHVKVCCWLALENRLLTWDNLNRRGLMDPGLCLLCGFANENILHLFVSCSFCQFVWKVIGQVINVVSPWCSETLSSCFLKLCKNYPTRGTLPCFIL